VNLASDEPMLPDKSSHIPSITLLLDFFQQGGALEVE